MICIMNLNLFPRSKRNGGNRAVAEACLHLLEKFYTPYNPEKLPENTINAQRDWTV